MAFVRAAALCLLRLGAAQNLEESVTTTVSTSTTVPPQADEIAFDPASPLTSYKDIGNCGPRGGDANADLDGQCSAGARVVKSVPNDNFKTVVEIKGCKYFEYTIFECNPVPLVPKFDPSSQLVSYGDIGNCGPRGNDAHANLWGCAAGAHVVKHVENHNYQVVATIDFCKYFTYTVWECNEVPDTPLFNPASPLVSYIDEGNCGPRGGDAEADTSSCMSGAEMVKHVPNQHWERVAIINGCSYFSYTVFACKDMDRDKQPFDPASPLTAYKDIGDCGPRGGDAAADWHNSCPSGAKVVKHVKGINYESVAVINGCKYFEYTIYECKPIPEKEKFDPTSPLVSYIDSGHCGPRGNDAQAELRQCPNGAHILEDVPLHNFEVVAIINYCTYFAYRVYECLPAPEKPLFDPESPLVSYKDIGDCGPRGGDAIADTSICPSGAHILRHAESTTYSTLATINGCNYFSYTVFTCNGLCSQGYYDCGDHCNWERSCKVDAPCTGEPPDGRCSFPKGERRGIIPNIGVDSFAVAVGCGVLLFMVVLLLAYRLTQPRPTGLPLLHEEEMGEAPPLSAPYAMQGRTLQSNPGPPETDGFSRF